jgi:hypothetical protein
MRLDSLIPRPRVHNGTTRQRPAERLIVFARAPSPTFDYYLASRLEQHAAPHSTVDLGGTWPPLDPRGAFVIFCRYASRASLNWIAAHASELAGVGLFLDDDLAAWLTAPEVPLGYRLYLLQNGIVPLWRLNRRLDRLWVSTDALAEAIGERRAIVLPPRPRPTDFASRLSPRRAGPVRIVFMAEYHSPEHRFLLPVMRRVLETRRDVTFEVTESVHYAARWATIAWSGRLAVPAVAGISRLHRGGARRYRAGAVAARPDQRRTGPDQTHRHRAAGRGRRVLDGFGVRAGQRTGRDVFARRRECLGRGPHPADR